MSYSIQRKKIQRTRKSNVLISQKALLNKISVMERQIKEMSEFNAFIRSFAAETIKLNDKSNKTANMTLNILNKLVAKVYNTQDIANNKELSLS